MTRQDPPNVSKTLPDWLWALLSLPAALIAYDLATATSGRVLHTLPHPTGEWSVRFLLVAMLASPLALVFRGWRGPRWLVKNRRYFGVAAFACAALHTVFYRWAEPLSRVLAEATRTDILAGWLGFAIFVPLAATSSDWAKRRMGPKWKALQRWTYAAAVLVLVHWAAFHGWRHWEVAAAWFAPLAALSAYRIWYWTLRPRKRRALAA